MLLAVEFVFTLGEMVGFPQLQQVVSLLAPADKRGMYFAIFGLRWTVGSIIGPLLGGWIMGIWNGIYLFSIVGSLILLAGVTMVWTLRLQSRKENLKEQVTTTV